MDHLKLEIEEKTREFGHGPDDLIRLDAMVAMRSIALGEDEIATAANGGI